jgi:hypothetical protein
VTYDIVFFLFQFRGAVCRWVSRTSRQADKKCGNLDSCSKSQSFFAGINLVQAGGGIAATSGGGGGGTGDKSQTLTTSLPDSARVSSLRQSYISLGTQIFLYEHWSKLDGFGSGFQAVFRIRNHLIRIPAF